MIHRTLIDKLKKRMGSGKAIILFGPRQVGKTTLVRELCEANPPYLFFDGDNPADRDLLNTPNTAEIRRILGANKLIFIDEAQRIANIGLTLKIIIDQIKNVQIIASGSSSFELANKANEPLTGRKWEYKLHPISWAELEGGLSYGKALEQLETRMLYGMYPDVINNPGDEQELLFNLVDSYMYKDILTFGAVKKPEVLFDLVRLLAYNCGGQVSYNKLGRDLGINKETVQTYVDVLEQAFIIFKLKSYSTTNEGKEIKHNKKIYFYDNGIRNAVLGNFSPLASRKDVGELWENFLISERRKTLDYAGDRARTYFWRNNNQKEIDYIEVRNDKVEAFEFKWSEEKRYKTPTFFKDTYGVDAKVVSRKDFNWFLV